MQCVLTRACFFRQDECVCVWFEPVCGWPTAGHRKLKKAIDNLTPVSRYPPRCAQMQHLQQLQTNLLWVYMVVPFLPEGISADLSQRSQMCACSASSGEHAGTGHATELLHTINTHTHARTHPCSLCPKGTDHTKESIMRPDNKTQLRAADWTVSHSDSEQLTPHLIMNITVCACAEAVTGIAAPPISPCTPLPPFHRSNLWCNARAAPPLLRSPFFFPNIPLPSRSAAVAALGADSSCGCVPSRAVPAQPASLEHLGITTELLLFCHHLHQRTSSWALLGEGEWQRGWGVEWVDEG